MSFRRRLLLPVTRLPAHLMETCCTIQQARIFHETIGLFRQRKHRLLMPSSMMFLGIKDHIGEAWDEVLMRTASCASECVLFLFEVKNVATE